MFTTHKANGTVQCKFPAFSNELTLSLWSEAISVE